MVLRACGPGMPNAEAEVSKRRSRSNFTSNDTTESADTQDSRAASEVSTSAYSALQYRRAPRRSRLKLCEAQGLVAAPFSELQEVAGSICCVLTQPELNSEELRGIGFAAVSSFGSAGGVPESSEATLVVTLGTDLATARAAVEKLDTAQVAGAIVAIIIVPFVHCGAFVRDADESYGFAGSAPSSREQPDRGAGAKVGNHLTKARRALFAAGADDVICLFAGESLQPYRVMEIIDRSANFAKRVSELVDSSVAKEKERASDRLQEAYRRFFQVMPTRMVRNTPPEDASLQEHQDEVGRPTGVTGYTFLKKLGRGAYGCVFEARSLADNSSCAVKVVPKSKAQGDGKFLFDLDSEIGIMQHLPPHPNVVKAWRTLHARSHYYLVMDYAGCHDLHKFTKVVLQESGDGALPGDTALSFARQQVSAVAHLHGCLICHRDLKPENWIVGEFGKGLRLADFGLAIQVVSAADMLKQACGSLPYVAPEVCTAESKLRPSPGYSGFAADMWSLGVNHMELLLGPKGVEALLGWRKLELSERQKRWEDIEGLPGIWAEQAGEVADRAGRALGEVIARTVVLEPAQRWEVSQASEALEPPAAPDRSPKAVEATAEAAPGSGWHGICARRAAAKRAEGL